MHKEETRRRLRRRKAKRLAERKPGERLWEGQAASANRKWKWQKQGDRERETVARRGRRRKRKGAGSALKERDILNPTCEAGDRQEHLSVCSRRCLPLSRSLVSAPHCYFQQPNYTVGLNRDILFGVDEWPPDALATGLLGRPGGASIPTPS